MNNIVRPKITKLIITNAAKEFAEYYPNFSADDISYIYGEGMDGYELGKELEKALGWHVDFDVCETLNEFQDYVEDEHLKICKEWAKTIIPPFEIGTRIKEGVIVGVNEFIPAAYSVQVDGAPEKTKRIISFEFAELAT